MNATPDARLARGTLASLLLLLLWTPGAEAQAPVTLKLATIVGVDNPFSTAAMRFKEVAETKSAGRLKVEVYPAGQLAKNETAMLESMQLGTVDVGAIATPSIGGKWDAKFLASDVPFLWESREHIWKVMDGSVGRELLKRLEPLGAQGFCFGAVMASATSCPTSGRPRHQTISRGRRSACRRSRRWSSSSRRLGPTRSRCSGARCTWP